MVCIEQIAFLAYVPLTFIVCAVGVFSVFRRDNDCRDAFFVEFVFLFTAYDYKSPFDRFHYEAYRFVDKEGYHRAKQSFHYRERQVEDEQTIPQVVDFGVERLIHAEYRFVRQEIVIYGIDYIVVRDKAAQSHYHCADDRAYKRADAVSFILIY